jgi:hypothetical protein
MRFWIGLVMLGAAGCAPSTVSIAGRVMAGFHSTDVAAGAHVELRDEAFGLVADADADADGVFFVDAPERAYIHLIVSGDGLVPASFPGESGDGPAFDIPNGQIFAVTEAELAAERADFLGCAGAEEADGVIYGTAWLSVPVADVTTGPPEPAAFAYVEDLNQTDKRTACYLDDAGSAVAPDATVAGTTGRFAIFGVAGGPWALTQGRMTSSSSSVLGRQTVYVPEGGVLARLPALVPVL